jgi:hypothetical protein
MMKKHIFRLFILPAFLLNICAEYHHALVSEFPCIKSPYLDILLLYGIGLAMEWLYPLR